MMTSPIQYFCSVLCKTQPDYRGSGSPQPFYLCRGRLFLFNKWNMNNAAKILKSFFSTSVIKTSFWLKKTFSKPLY